MNDMLGGVHYLPNGVKKYYIDRACRFVCHPHSDFAGFCDPTYRLTGYLIPLPYELMCTHVWVGTNWNTPTFLSWWVWCSHILW